METSGQQSTQNAQAAINDSYDVVVIGGGPAGATTGALLAEMGHSVLILERDKFPRYHVGESLIPFCYPTLKRLGMIKPMIRSAFVKKYSVQFVGTSGAVSKPYYFYQHMKHNSARTWQVTRAEFDEMMLNNARDKGATAIEEISVRELIVENEAVKGVVARSKDGQESRIQAKIVVDASGRDAVSMRLHNWRMNDPKLNKIALWTYFEGAKRDLAMDEGATTVAFIPKKGWFWYIPLHDNRVSVGVVADKSYLYRDGRDPQEIFDRERKANSWIDEHLACGQQAGPIKVTGDYSYRSKHCSRDGLVLTGDAFAFLDPVFSSGVFLALKSGSLVADAIDSALRDGDYRAERFTDYGEKLCDGIEAMRRLVYAFYDEGFNFGTMLKKYPDLRTDLTDCLIGNVDRDFTQLWDAVAEFAQLPDALDYGRPAERSVLADA